MSDFSFFSAEERLLLLHSSGVQACLTCGFWEHEPHYHKRMYGWCRNEKRRIGMTMALDFCTEYKRFEGYRYRRKEVFVILDTDMPGSELLYYVRKRLEPDVRVIDVRARNYSGGKLGV